jgi:hypothetical protein
VQTRISLLTVPLVALALGQATTDATPSAAADASDERGSKPCVAEPVCRGTGYVRRDGSELVREVQRGTYTAFPYRKGGLESQPMM